MGHDCLDLDLMKEKKYVKTRVFLCVFVFLFFCFFWGGVQILASMDRYEPFRTIVMIFVTKKTLQCLRNFRPSPRILPLHCTVPTCVGRTERKRTRVRIRLKSGRVDFKGGFSNYLV